MVYPPSPARPAHLWRAARPLALAVPILCCGLACCGPGAAEPDAANPDNPVRVASGPQASPGEFVVDVRPPEAFAAGHAPGAINLQWQFGQFALRAQRLFPAGSTLRIVGEDAAVEASLADAHRLGFVAQRGPAAAADGGSGVERLPVLTVAQLKERLDRGEVSVLDTRTASEYASGHIPGAVFVYPDDIARVEPLLARDRPIAVICEAGWRSSLVASWLRREGHLEVFNVIAGMNGWAEAGLPVETAEDQQAWK